MCTASWVISFAMRSKTILSSSSSSCSADVKGKSWRLSTMPSRPMSDRGMYFAMLNTPTLATQSLAPIVGLPPDLRGASVIATVRAEFARRPAAIQANTSSASISPSKARGTGASEGTRRTATRKGQKKAAQIDFNCENKFGSGSPGPNGNRCRHCLSDDGPILSLFASKAVLKASKVCMSSGCRLSQSLGPGSGIGSNQTSANRSTRCNIKGEPLLLPRAFLRASVEGTSNLQGPLVPTALLLQQSPEVQGRPLQQSFTQAVRASWGGGVMRASSPTESAKDDVHQRVDS
mmetsp:Transcript_24345/g.38977  ORF Transcript_24345/g.38977 Transcript_24345/m.38977 type:complete len:291 (-) Transcript_24345:62-934(-)